LSTGEQIGFTPQDAFDRRNDQIRRDALKLHGLTARSIKLRHRVHDLQFRRRGQLFRQLNRAFAKTSLAHNQCAPMILQRRRDDLRRTRRALIDQHHQRHP
jgi:hypothetical protein